VWILLSFSLCCFIAVLYCRSAGYRDPTSIFFDSQLAYDQQYSAHRAKEANEYIAASGQSEQAGPVIWPPLICVGVPTVARRRDQYVQTTVGSLLVGLEDDERKLMFLNLFIAHLNSVEHPIFSEVWPHTLPDRLLQYPTSAAEYRQILAWEEEGWYRNKSIYDFTYLLNDCFETGAEYVAIIEDDTLATDGWLKRLLDALNTVEDKMETLYTGQKWMYLRLFYTEELLGWNSEEWPTYLVWSFVAWATISAVMLMIRRTFPRQGFMTKGVIATVSFVCIPAGTALFFLAGKQTTFPLTAGIHEMNKYGCCSQGLVFPRSIIPELLRLADVNTDWLVDMMVEQISNDEELVRWAIVPPLLQHIGATSSKGYGFDHSARQMWNFRYELYPIKN
jgi:GR25 family glycosyltransferase involved in LPS biosynthesis